MANWCRVGFEQSYRVTKKEWTPLSCKFDLYQNILGKIDEVISNWLGLDNSFDIYQVPGHEDSSRVLPKMINNNSNLHERGAFLSVTL